LCSSWWSTCSGCKNTRNALDLPPDERADVINRLGGEIYNQWILRKYVLIRLDELLSDPQTFPAQTQYHNRGTRAPAEPPTGQ
jgi:hypothetical protein